MVTMTNERLRTMYETAVTLSSELREEALEYAEDSEARKSLARAAAHSDETASYILTAYALS